MEFYAHRSGFCFVFRCRAFQSFSLSHVGTSHNIKNITIMHMVPWYQVLSLKCCFYEEKMTSDKSTQKQKLQDSPHELCYPPELSKD